jgi:adenylyltransferase/sulfurtransferase
VRFNLDTAHRIVGEGWDVIIDGADNFPTRYALNDIAVQYDLPLCHGSVDRFEGQVTTFGGARGPCYRCLFPRPPEPGTLGSCAERGVLGVLPGMIGMLQATEALKLLLGIGQPLLGRLLIYDALAMSFRQIGYIRNVACPVCGKSQQAL